MKGRKPIAPRALTSKTNANETADIAEPAWVVVHAPDWAESVARVAAAKWRELVDAMGPDGACTLGPENAIALEMACKFYARWRMAEAQIDKLGPIIRAPVTGVPMVNPFHSIANAAADRFIKLAAELGLTPAMRGRVEKRPIKQVSGGWSTHEL